MKTDPNLPLRDILILTQYYWPEPGAPQIRLRNMARELSRLGKNVRVLTGMPNYPLGKIFDGYRGKAQMKEVVDGVPVERVWLYAAAGRGSFKRILNYLSFTFLVMPRVIFGPRPDLVFVEAQPLTLAFPAWLLRIFRGVPYVYNTPDLQVEGAAEANWIQVNWFIRLARALECFLMRHALSVTTVTHAFVEHFIQHRAIPRNRLSFLPNGADVDRLHPLPHDHSYAQAMGTGDRKVFTYAGTHAHYQGLEVIVEAAKLLADRKDIVILMVGKGPVREQLIKESASAKLENILFRDSPFEEMPRLMSITYASLVVLKNMPIAKKMRLSKTIPPLSCGVPVIYAGLGEAAEILRNERCGVVVEPERPDKLAQAIRDLADRPQQRTEMGGRGRLLAERDFSWRFLVGDWMRQMTSIKAGEDPKVPGLP
jgi:glycosyltransferase involved in cell wall biosynthesis